MLSRSLLTTFRNWRVAFVLLPLAVTLRILDPWPVEQLRLKLFDLYQELNPRQVDEMPVVIIDIDEASLNEFGQWPWPRNLLARLVDFAAGAEVHAIGFDILFPDRDRLSPESLREQYRNLPPELSATLDAMPSNDSLLADSIARAKVVLGVALSPSGLSDGRSLPLRTPVFERGGDPRSFLTSYSAIVANIDRLSESSSGQGVVSLAARQQGVVRSLPAIVRVNGSLLPSMGIELLRVAAGGESVAVHSESAGIAGISFTGQFVRTDQSGHLWPHFSLHESGRFVSARDVLNGTVDPDSLAGRFVLIGTTAVGLGDLFATPVGVNMSGVEIHAQLLETLLAGGLLHRPNFTVAGELAVMLVLCIFLVAVHARRKAISTIGFFLVLFVAVVGSSWLTFLLDDTLVDASYPLLIAFVLYVFLVSGGFLREERERRRREQRLRELQNELINVSRASAMSQLSSALAHELNQPLTAIINYIQAGRRVMARAPSPVGDGADERRADAPIQAPGGELLEKVGGMMAKALAQAERASGIIRGLRDTFENREATRAPEDLAKIVEEAVLLGQIGSAPSGAMVSTRLREGLPMVDVNRIQVQQVIVNLVRNAIEAVEESPVRRVLVEAFPRSDGVVEVVVSDSGPGVPPEVREKLFQAFVTTKNSGMGIGLSVCYSIIESNGGEMWLANETASDSARNGEARLGAAFHFTLPAVEQETL